MNKITGQPRSKMSVRLDENSKVLFVCYSNAGRSHFAQGFYNHFSRSDNASSAGVNPNIDLAQAPTLVALEKQLNMGVKTTETMAEVGIDVTNHKRQKLNATMLNDYDLIVNLAEKSQTPAWLHGSNVVWWDIPDPHGESWQKNREARDEIEWRVKKLIAGEIVDDSEKGGKI